MVYNNASEIKFDTLKSRDIVSLNCNQCHNYFNRTVKYIKYKLSQGQTVFYCSDSCAKKYRSTVAQENNTATCTFCKTTFVKKSQSQTLCSKSCSNKNRTHSDLTKSKISKSLLLHNTNPNHERKIITISKDKVRVNRRDLSDKMYCKIYICKCKNCNSFFSHKSYRKFCTNCQSSYAQNGRARFKFKFNIYDYPDLFDLKSLYEIGWKSRRGDKSNPNGMTRDHRVSVKDAIEYNYEPYYISHPLNCELMRMIDNQKKNASSSITYEELVKLVIEYDSKYGAKDGTRTRDT